MLVPNRANGRPEGGQVLLTQVRARENLLPAWPPLPGTFPRPAVVKRQVADDPLGGIGGAGFVAPQDGADQDQHEGGRPRERGAAGHHRA